MERVLSHYPSFSRFPTRTVLHKQTITSEKRQNADSNLVPRLRTVYVRKVFSLRHMIPLCTKHKLFLDGSRFGGEATIVLVALLKSSREDRSFLCSQFFYAEKESIRLWTNRGDYWRTAFSFRELWARVIKDEDYEFRFFIVAIRGKSLECEPGDRKKWRPTWKKAKDSRKMSELLVWKEPKRCLNFNVGEWWMRKVFWALFTPRFYK